MKTKLFHMIAITALLIQPAAAKTTLTWWQFWTDPSVKPVIESMVSEFEQANPDIDVELTDLTWSNGHEKIVIAFAHKPVPILSNWVPTGSRNLPPMIW